MAIRGGPPRHYALRSGRNSHRVLGRCPARHPRGPPANRRPGHFLGGLVWAVATAARPEELQLIQAAVKDQGGISSLPAWARAATQHLPGAATPPSSVPRPAWALEA